MDNRCQYNHLIIDKSKSVFKAYSKPDIESWDGILKTESPKSRKYLRVFCWPCNSRQVSNAVEFDASKSNLEYARKCHMHSTNVGVEIEIWKSWFDLSFVICHLSFVICHLWFVICHLSFVICHLWFVICDLWFVICDSWFVIYHLSFVICHLLFR
jgi:hypothetical protein